MAERLGNGLQNRVQQFESAWDLTKRTLLGVSFLCWWGGRADADGRAVFRASLRWAVARFAAPMGFGDYKVESNVVGLYGNALGNELEVVAYADGGCASES